VSWTLLNLGVVQRLLGKHQEAEVNIQQSMEIFRSSVGTNHIGMSLRCNALAHVYMGKGEYEKAEEMFLRDLEVRKRHLGPRHADLGYPLTGLGELHFKTGEYRKAKKYFIQTIDIHEATLGKQHPVLGETYYELGLVYEQSQHGPRKAHEYFSKAWEILSKSPTSNDKILQDIKQKLQQP